PPRSLLAARLLPPGLGGEPAAPGGRAAHGRHLAAPGGGGDRRRSRRRVAGGGRRGFWGPVPQPGLERGGGAGALRDHAGAGLRRGAGAAGPAAAATRGAAAGAAGAVRGHAAAGLPPRPHLRPGRGGGRGRAAVRLLPRGQPLQPHVGARRRGHEPQISLWSLLVTLVILFILTGTMLGPDLMAHIPASVYAIAVLMPLAGYALGYGLATVFKMPPHCRRTVSLETGCQNVQLCTAILKLTFPPELIGSMYMFPLLYALFQSAEAGLFVLAYKMYGRDSYKQDTLGEEEDTDISYKKLKEEEVADTSYGTVTAEGHNSVPTETTQTAL
uniref:Solute carrier family 10 member 4 n=1 Tax=Calidris pygmaea TaxID=425635 RepID=A0A8C3KYR2_9CHAR